MRGGIFCKKTILPNAISGSGFRQISLNFRPHGPHEPQRVTLVILSPLVGFLFPGWGYILYIYIYIYIYISIFSTII